MLISFATVTNLESNIPEPEPITDKITQDTGITAITSIGDWETKTMIEEPANPKKMAERMSEVIFEINSGNVGVWLSGNGSWDKLMFIELENELFKACIVKTPITSDSGEVAPLITIIKKEKTAALNRGSRSTHNRPNL